MQVKKKYKIAVICDYKLLQERIGGMDAFFWLFDSECKKSGFQISWFFPNDADFSGYKNLEIISADGERLETFFISHCKKNQINFDVVFTHFIELCTSFFLEVKKISNPKIIAVDHNPRPVNGYTLKKIITKRIKGILYSRYIDTFIGVSDYSKKQLIKEFGFQIKNKVKVILNGLEINKFRQKTNFDSNCSFIIASHLRKDKGIQDVVQAVNKIKSHLSSDFTINIYGEGHYENELKKMIADFSLQQYFIFKGSVDNLDELYSEYDYLVHPSHGETFCYTVIEALLSNLPVITTRNQGNVLGFVKENRNGFLYDEGNVDSLSVILKKCVNQEIKINDGLKKEPSVTNLSLEKMVSEYVKLLN